VQRGNNRQAIFFHDDDYHAYWGYLREALIKHDCSMDAYLPMTHHVHVLTLGKVTGAISRLPNCALGSNRFQDAIETMIGRRTRIVPQGRPKNPKMALKCNLSAPSP
jgi:hypothetical protein